MTSQPTRRRRASADRASGARCANAGLRVELRALVNVDGEAFLGPGRVELLDAVRSSGSLSAAARALGMSYRKAWLLMSSMNRAVGAPLTELATGGTGGGGARLTPLGERMLRAFRRLEAESERLRSRMEGRLAAVVAGAGGAGLASRAAATRRGAGRPPGKGATRTATRAGASPGNAATRRGASAPRGRDPSAPGRVSR